MNLKKLKIFLFFFLGIMLLGGCGTNKTAANIDQTQGGSNGKSDVGIAADKKTVTIAASFYPIYIMALNVAGGIPNVKVIDMTKQTTGCLHDYTVTPEDMKNLENAQFLIINGAGMESFMDKITSQMADLKIIDSSKGIQLIKGYGDEGDNPHLWVSISNAVLQVKNIGEQLALLDPGNAEKYKANTEAYVKKLENERDKMHEELKDIRSRDIVTFHEAFPYFAKEFGLNIAGVIEREPGSEPSARELDETVERVKELKVKALFAEPQYPAKAARTIANETGTEVYTLDPGVTGSMDAEAYINIMDNNLKTLKEALK